MDYNPIRWGWRYLVRMGWRYYHPGEDFNWGNYAGADLGKPVWASTDSVVEYSGFINGWGYLVVLYSRRYDRYFRHGHLRNVTIKKGDHLKEGEQFAECAGTNIWSKKLNKSINDYSPHLHYDIPKFKFSNWGKYTRGMTEQQVKDKYENPLEFIERIAKQEAIDKKENEPEIVTWAKHWGIKSKWTLPYNNDDVFRMYEHYHTTYLTLSESKRKQICTIKSENEKMDTIIASNK